MGEAEEEEAAEGADGADATAGAVGGTPDGDGDREAEAEAQAQAEAEAQAKRDRDADGARVAAEGSGGSDDGAAKGVVSELRLRRSLVHRKHDMKRLQDEKEDLNDALLDFFVKLGQAVIPCGGLEGGFPSVAYLGSFFYDVLQKGGVRDGKAGHANVANWAKRRLGNGGLFFDGIGALAVPINEMLVSGSLKEKHWWLALLLNPRGGGRPKSEEELSLLCLDSLARAEVRCDPPIRAYRYGNTAYPLDVVSLYRQSFSAIVRFKATGNGSSGALPDLKGCKLVVGGREFTNPYVELRINQPGGYGQPGHFEGSFDFSLDSSVLTSGEYVLHFGEPGAYYSPAPKLRIRRDPTVYQRRVSQFLGGYCAKEWVTSGAAAVRNGAVYDGARVEAGLRLPDTPQQETANDCGYFMLEQILLALQLTPDGFRTLAGASTDMVATLPWPTQKDVARRKLKLRDALEHLFLAADEESENDVDALLKADYDLRSKIQAALWDGPRFAEAVRTLAQVSGPRKEYTMEEIEAMTTKQLRTVCAQHGVLPNGMCERSDLISALSCFAKKPEAKESARSSPSPPNENGSGKRTVENNAPQETEAKRQRTDVEHLGSLVFTESDLATFPLKKLRDLCKQHKVLPSNALERADFVRALLPLVNGAKPAAVAATNGTADASVAAKQASQPAEETMEQRKARWARMEGEHLAGVTFVMADLEVMPLKVLRALCVQHKVLPACAVERFDFVSALTPLAGQSAGRAAPSAEAKKAETPHQAPPKPPQALRKDFSKFLGSVKPNFTKADLEDMPLSTLRTLCMKHGCLPPGEKADSVSELRFALGKKAVRPASSANTLTVDDLDDI